MGAADAPRMRFIACAIVVAIGLLVLWLMARLKRAEAARHRAEREEFARAIEAASSKREEQLLDNLRVAEARAASDQLTGLPNRPAAEDATRRMLAHASRHGSACAVAMLDLDHFARVNDTYGREAGDRLLVGVGNAMMSAVRASDLVARVGGDEFLVVLPDTDLRGGVVALEKLRSAIAAVRLSSGPQHATASFGLAVFPDDGHEPAALMRGAARALQDAKRSGGDRVRTLRTVELVSSADDV
jgi:diguanylate cyclase (GGDEF)-like protein